MLTDEQNEKNKMLPDLKGRVQSAMANALNADLKAALLRLREMVVGGRGPARGRRLPTHAEWRAAVDPRRHGDGALSHDEAHQNALA